jgi:hypothetical protein
MIPAYPVRSRPGGLVHRVAAIDLRGVRRRGGSDKAPLCYTDDYANPLRFAPHVVFRAGSFSRHARHLPLSCISRMRVVSPAATSRHPCGDELASRPLRCRAHSVVGSDKRLRGQFRIKRTCRNRRRVLNLKCRRVSQGARVHVQEYFLLTFFIVFDPEIRCSRTAPFIESAPRSAAARTWTALCSSSSAS